MDQPINPFSTWPALPAADWADTRQTLHLWTQIVGKTRLALSPMLNHWWQVPLYVTPRGLSTGPMPYAGGSCEVVFDFRQHKLRVHTSAGRSLELALQPRSVADFYRHYRALLREAGIAVKLWPVPMELEDTTPFHQDEHHKSYDAAAVGRFWDVLLAVDQLLNAFRGRFTGKCSPVHFFWGSFDLAVTRFSGRPAPPHPGGMPHLADWVTRESYSAEQIAAGWWPGGNGQEAAFYSYAYPGNPAVADAVIEPVAAFYSGEMGEFFLPYEAARTAPNPADAVLGFLQSTYQAAASLAHWDRVVLERA
ncbi:DUF5996 family protein [Hymenobacter sp. BRD67]|uniref:DUF5996 family protein n=1 Tax=Hymenobacter sp. BRD67 TaxID=2675877 RepID=UPI001564A8DC|nr:DUF5996 family protein [Hymenobacter sp. BRD67]QKG54279.1 hypothetical protein GKZ67_18860 [Hymenobacter sp. BRD67]